MIQCYRVVDNSTTNDPLPPPGSCLAEALNLCRTDPKNVSTLMKRCGTKLQSSQPIVRLKALRLMTHLANNGPPGVIIEVRLYNSLISDCIGFRADISLRVPQETYDDIRDTAQNLLDLSFRTQTAAPQKFSIPVNNTDPSMGNNSFSNQPGYGNVYGSTSNVPVNQNQNLGEKVTSFFKEKIASIGHRNSATYQGSNPYPNHNSAYTQSYGSEQYNAGQTQNVISGNNYGQYNQQYNQPYNQQYNQPYNSSAQPYNSSTQPYNPSVQQYNQTIQAEQYTQPRSTTFQNQVPSSYAAAPPKKLSSTIPKKPVPNTPAKKLMRVVGGRALATQNEIEQFRSNATPESIDEFIEGLEDSDWKVKMRAVIGLETCGQVFGLGVIAKAKNTVQLLTTSPQMSLRNASNRLYQSIKDVEPTTFDFTETPNEESNTFQNQNAAADQGEAIFSFDMAGDDDILTTDSTQANSSPQDVQPTETQQTETINETQEQAPEEENAEENNQ